MRLVSAVYGGYYPFDGCNLFDDFVATTEPDDLKKGDYLVVWGGSDIPPEYYGKGRSQKSWAGDKPSRRDEIEWTLIQRAIREQIPVIGVCRGGQMLCAAAGGYLIQHITGHGGTHNVISNDGVVFPVNSIHHQMMVPGDAKHILLAHTKENLSREYWDVNEVHQKWEMEPEYFYFPEIRGHAIQWHPEGLSLQSYANKFVFNKLEEFNAS